MKFQHYYFINTSFIQHFIHFLIKFSLFIKFKQYLRCYQYFVIKFHIKKIVDFINFMLNLLVN